MVGKQVFSVTDYGAVGDKNTLDRAAIQVAIDACAASGGGTVSVPAGDYLAGTLHLKSRVTLWLQGGATLWGSTNRDDYDVPHLIYAKDAVDVTVLGPGRIDGQGEAFWVQRDGRWRPAEWRPGKLLHFEGCRQVRMRDFTVTNAPAWTIHPFKCDDVVISGVTILNDVLGPNTDGIDPNCSTNVRISDCHIVAGDDCIVIKATEPFPCENIAVTNCTLETTCAALKLGTETHGDIRHVVFSNCVIRNTSAGLTLYAKDGGTLEDVLFSDITIEMLPSQMYGKREWAIFMDVERRGEDSKTSKVRDVTLRNVVIHSGGRFAMQGMRSSPIARLTLDGIVVKATGYEDLAGLSKPRGGRTRWQDPDAGQHVGAPAQFVFANIDGLCLRNVRVVTETDADAPDWSAVFCDCVSDVLIDGFAGRQTRVGGEASTLALGHCADVWIRNCRAVEGSGTFLNTDDDCSNVYLTGNDLSRAKDVAHHDLDAEGNRVS